MQTYDPHNLFYLPPRLRIRGHFLSVHVSVSVRMSVHPELDLRNDLYEFHHIRIEYEVGPGHDAHFVNKNK